MTLKKKVSIPVFIGLAILVLIAKWAINYFALFQRVPNSQEISTSIQTSLPDSVSNALVSESAVQPKVEEVVRGLQVPWSIVFVPTESGSRMYVTERDGKVRVIENGQLQSQPIHIFSQVSSRGEEGLMGMTLDPDYSTNKFVYFCYAYSVEQGLQDRVVKMTDQGDTFSDAQVIIDNLPAATNHAGCRIKFGPDKKLYITTGDATDKNIAQDKNSLGGKILRLNSDGSIPADNPFPNSPIYSLGHRNPQGIAWHPETGQLFATEHGPSGFDGPAGGDEINMIEKGQNYGWPIVSHDKSQAGLVDPLITFTPAVAPASAMFYSGNVFPQWKNHFFFGGLRGQGLFRVEIEDGKVARYEKLPEVDFGRIREVVEGPDGYIYFSTSNQDGRGTVRAGDDKIYRIVPTQ